MPTTNKNKELTPRQKEILALLRKGFTNNEICKILCISSNTVKVHLANIYKILEVTNRTEAAFSEEQKIDEISPSEEKKLNIVVNYRNNPAQPSKISAISNAVIEALHHYHLFRIHENEDIPPSTGYQIELTAATNEKETVFVNLKMVNSTEILWTTSQNIKEDDLQFQANQIAAQLFRQMNISTAQLDYTSKTPLPYWWYISCYSKIKIEAISKDEFSACAAKLKPIVMGENYNLYAAYQLSILYYLSVLESMENAPDCIEKLGEIARRAMRDAPYSIYSQLMMSFYNIVIGNKSEAIAYLQQVINENPYDGMARSLLPQVYLLTGQEDKALEALNEGTRLMPGLNQEASNMARTFIYFLQEKYDKCKELAQQILLFRPDSVYARTLTIACFNKEGDTEACDAHIKKLFEYNPNFSVQEFEKLLAGITPSKRKAFAEQLQYIFQKK